MKKAVLFALAVSVMMFALPSVASAKLKTWDLTYPGHTTGKSITFNVDGTTATTLKTHADTIECTDVSGTGKYTTTTTGTLNLTFHGCADKATGVSCKSGATNGTIDTTELAFHNVYVDHNGTTGAAVLITPNPTTGVFAHFGCTFFGIGAHITVNGTGVIGTVESCKAGTSFGINFQEAAAGTQTHVTAEVENTSPVPTYDLTSIKNGGAAVTASQTGTGDVIFPESVTPDCTT